MKYFIAHGFGIGSEMKSMFRSESDQDYEIPKERAYNMYRDKAGSGKLNLVAIPNFNKGALVFIRQGTISLWGEDIGESECFRRRLVGSLHTDVQD